MEIELKIILANSMLEQILPKVKDINITYDFTLESYDENSLQKITSITV
jgi:hypothetical protein